MTAPGGLRSDFLLTVSLWAQRLNLPVPSRVRRAGRALLSHLAGRRRAPAQHASSNSPLAGRRPSRPEPGTRTAPETPPVRTVDRVAGAPTGVGSRRGLRCVVLTSALDAGGMDEFAGFLARGLPKHGIDVAVVHTTADHAGTEGRVGLALRKEGLPVVQLSPGDCQRWLRSQGAEVISAHGAPDAVVEAAAELGIPYVETLHGMHSLFDEAAWPREHRRSRLVTGFVAVSDLVRRQYLARNPGFPPERITTIPNGVDHLRIGRADRAGARSSLGLQGEFLFVSLARYCLQKNTYALVDAFTDVARDQPDAHLLVAGRADDPVYLAQVRRLRDRSAYADRIHLLEHCPDPSRWLAAADAFVLDAFFEGWPLASMEALFTGLPVVISEVGGAWEQVGESGRRGYVVANPLGDPNAVNWMSMRAARYGPQSNRAALVAAMATIVEDRHRWAGGRIRLGEESALRFSADVCLRRHAEVLARAVSGESLSDGTLVMDPV